LHHVNWTITKLRLSNQDMTTHYWLVCVTWLLSTSASSY